MTQSAAGRGTRGASGRVSLAWAPVGTPCGAPCGTRAGVPSGVAPGAVAGACSAPSVVRSGSSFMNDAAMIAPIPVTTPMKNVSPIARLNAWKNA